VILAATGRLRTSGDGFRPGSIVKILVMNAAGAQTPIGEVRVNSEGTFASTLSLSALRSAAGDRVLQFAGVTDANTERAISLGVRVVGQNTSITLVGGKRVSIGGQMDRIRATGSTSGIPAGSTLVPHIREGGQGPFTRGVATIVVNADGTFRWQRKVSKNRNIQAYVSFAGDRSNTEVWVRIR
jgi:hypothetical protein